MSKREKMRQSRSRLENSQRRLQRSEVELFAAGVAHEFNNVLGAAMGHAEWALDSGESADMKEALQLVIKACERSREITWALKGLAQPREERLGEIQLEKLIEETSSWAKSFLESDGILFEVTPSAKISFEGDFEQLKEILVNLIKNARDSLCERGAKDPSQTPKISLVAESQGDEIFIRVCDNGVGVPVEFRDVIFRPFFTTKGSMGHVAVPSSGLTVDAKQLSGGMGLGLYMARNAALEHGGNLTISPEGSEFVLRLPR